MTVAGGVGLALLPQTLLNDPAFANVLRPVLTDFPLRESTLYLIYPARKHLPFKARAFIDLVLEPSPRSQGQAQTGLTASRRPSVPEPRVLALAC